MTRKELDALAKKTDAELIPLIVTDIHQQENLVSQRDDAIQRIEAFDAEKAALVSAHAAELATKESLITALGGTEAGLQLKKEKELADAVAAKEAAIAAVATAEAKIEELSKTDERVEK